MVCSVSTTAEKCHLYTLWKADLILIKFPLLSSKIGCMLNNQLLHDLPSEISHKQNRRNCQCVYHTGAPKVIKTGWSLTEIFQKIKRWAFFLLGHSVVTPPHSMRSRVYETVECPSVCLSVPSIDSSSGGFAAERPYLAPFWYYHVYGVRDWL